MNLRVRYNDLTPQEKAIICNGCGPKALWLPLPKFMFRACCDHHDFNYWIGCKEIQRKKADLQFYREMIHDANVFDSVNTRKRRRAYAAIYYRAVRLCGFFCFHYARKQRTRIDLQKAMDAANDVKGALT
jgi:hypothetical protein